MAKIYRIYKCTNMNNGKTYIGFTHKVLEKRIKDWWDSRKAIGK
jgi:hypothetical protein